MSQLFGGQFGGQFGSQFGQFGSFGLLSKLRRTYIVIIGADAPQTEKDNADAAASHMMQKLNFSRAIPSDDQKLERMTKFANIILVGGPLANEWAFKLNDLMNPKWNITVLKTRTEGQTWKDYIVGGGIAVNGWTFNGTNMPFGVTAKKGFLGSGKQTLPRIRPLQILSIAGITFEDTCCMVKAFLEDQPLGVYDTVYAVSDPTYSKCPVDGNYHISVPA